MGDDAYEPAAARHAHERGQRLLQRLAVERAETLVDEHRLKLHAAGARLHLVRQAERQRQGGGKRLAAGERLDAARRAVVVVDDLELQPGLAAVVARTLAAAQLVLPAGHDEQARVRAPEDAVKIRGLQKRLERDLLLSGDGTVRGRRQRVHPLPALVRSVVFLPLRVELGARRAVLLQPRVEGVHLRL